MGKPGTDCGLPEELGAAHPESLRNLNNNNNNNRSGVCVVSQIVCHDDVIAQHQGVIRVFGNICNIYL